MNNFGEWINENMQERGWSQAELARKSNLSQASISLVVNGQRKPGEELCQAIAGAFRIPTEIVYRAAGLLPPVSEKNERVERILNYLETLPEADAERVELFVAALSNQQQKVKPKTGPLRGKP